MYYGFFSDLRWFKIPGTTRNKALNDMNYWNKPEQDTLIAGQRYRLTAEKTCWECTTCRALTKLHRSWYQSVDIKGGVFFNRMTK